MTTGEILDELKRANKDARVYFSFCRLTPTSVASWRGIYAEPAIGWSAVDWDKDAMTVQKLIDELTMAISGQEYAGWKGGAYRYKREHTLHVDNPGECTSTELDSLTIGENVVILHTVNREEW